MSQTKIQDLYLEKNTCCIDSYAGFILCHKYMMNTTALCFAQKTPFETQVSFHKVEPYQLAHGVISPLSVGLGYNH